MRYTFDFDGKNFIVVDTYVAEGITVYSLSEEDFKDLHHVVTREADRRNRRGD